jgi:hypothetical protein
VSSVVVRGFRPSLAALAAVAAVLATVAGCSSSSSSTTFAVVPSDQAGASDPVPSASMTALPAASGQLTGTQLESVLLPQSDFPAGFAAPSSGPISSGDSLTSGPATYNLATISCATFIQHLGTTGFGETAMVSVGVAAGSQAYDQLIYQFAAASGATGFLSGVQALADRCGSFKATANGQAGTFSLKATTGSPVAGHPSVELDETGTLGSSKLVLDTLLSASGVDVFGATSVGVSGSAGPTVPTSESVVWEQMKRQAAVSVLGS